VSVAPVPRRPGLPRIELVPLLPGDRYRPAVLALSVLPEQEIYCGRAATTLPHADADPARTPFVVLQTTRPAGVVVGFGVLDRVGILAQLVDEPVRAVLLRGFYVDARQQGRGLGTAAAAAVPRLAGSLFPGAELVVLTVNEDNPAAVLAYTRAGFTGTGVRYLGGGAGPQHVMVAAVPPGPTCVRRSSIRP